MSDEEGAAIQHLAANRRVLELGSYLGRSTLCMAGVARQVFAVDHHRGDANCGNHDTLSAFMANVRGVPNIIPIVGRFNDVWPVLGKHAFDLVFVDGAHDYESTLRAGDIAMVMVKTRGVVAFHDWDQDKVQTAAYTALVRTYPDGIAGALAWFNV